jgi:hypothetical protein
MAHYVRIAKEFIGVPLTDLTVKGMIHIIGAQAGDLLMTNMADPSEQFVISRTALEADYRCLDKPKRGRPRASRSGKIIPAYDCQRETVSRFVMPTVREVTREILSNIPESAIEEGGTETP